MDVKMIDYISINLQDYIGKEVTVLLRNNQKEEGLLTFHNRYPEYPYRFERKLYNKNGKCLMGYYGSLDIAFLWVDEKVDEELEEKLRKATEKVMTKMYGGNTPIVPDETIEEWKKQGLLSETPTLPEMIEVNGVKYQRVEEPQKPKTLWERFYDAKWSDSACDEFCEIVEEWISQYGCDYNDRYAEGYEDALKTLKENLK